MPTCVFKSPSGDLIASFQLTIAVGTLLGTPGVTPNTSYTNSGWKGVYNSAYQDYTDKLAEANAIVGKTARVDELFTALQNAENSRDTAPDAYEAARIAYYTLVKGDEWLKDEKARIADVEAQPIVDGYIAQYNGIQEKKNQQQSTIDVVNGVRDKILTVKDDLTFSVSTFQKQIGDIKNQINKDKIEQTQSITAASSWVDTFLNWVIALVTIVAIVLLGRRFYKGGPAPTIEEIESKARLIRAQAMLRNANVRSPRGWW